MSVEEVLARIVRNRPYFGRDGGVTVSGGEPLFMAPFVRELFLRAKDLGIHTCLDTSGALLNDDVRSLLTATDLCLLDIKATDGPGYSVLCGIGFDAPLAFLKELDRRGVPTWIRQVIVPGLNDTADCVRALNAVITPFSCVKKVELLPFHNMCIETYRRLGLPFPLSGTKPMSDAALAGLSAQIVLP
jgi:pyruvate formate lyase activating enzyme